MSVKFQQETIRASGVKPEGLAHKVGERLTGGHTQTGYLAVCVSHAEEDNIGEWKGWLTSVAGLS
jgi:hypothetical protein